MSENKNKILVVDDQEAYVLMIQELLEGNNFEVITAINGKEAILKTENNIPDLIITDIVMPELDGIEVLLEIKKSAPEIPVIVMSGGNYGYGQSYLNMAKKLGANVILDKPFEMDVLLKQVKELLDK